MKRVAKIILILFLITTFIAFFALVNLFLRRRLRDAYLSRLSHISSVLIRWILGIRIRVIGAMPPKAPTNTGFFFVCNHVSYLDGIILSSVFPMLFIGRGDLKDWPLLGIFTRLSGTIFVNRNSAANIHADIAHIESVLRNGVNVILFPEGTTTDGNKILPFKSAFFQAPISCQCPIVALSINYVTINGGPVTQANKDNLYWYSETGFLTHFMRVLALDVIEVEVRLSEAIDEFSTHNRKTVRTLMQKTIEENLRKVCAPHTV